MTTSINYPKIEINQNIMNKYKVKKHNPEGI